MLQKFAAIRIRVIFHGHTNDISFRANIDRIPIPRSPSWPQRKSEFSPFANFPLSFVPFMMFAGEDEIPRSRRLNDVHELLWVEHFCRKLQQYLVYFSFLVSEINLEL